MEVAGHQGSLDPFTGMKFTSFNKKYGAKIEDVLEDKEHIDLKLPKSSWGGFKRCVFDHLRSRMRTSHASGVVIVGYGEDEIYPSLSEVIVDGGFFDSVRLIDGRQVDISRTDEPVAIEAFAQSDVAESFLHGFDEDYRREIIKMLTGFLHAQIDDIVENHTKYDKDTKKVIRAAQKKGIPSAVKQFADALDEFAYMKYTEPAHDVLRHATKDEMAEMAEALVSLTALKRRVSPQRETVGGLVGVAVVSKGTALFG